MDFERPRFSNPTRITNAWFPISELESVVLTGTVDDLPFRAETTLLPFTGFVVVDGERIEVALSQYTAYLDGRITEVAVDRYAQADDGSVWYLGEDVYDYDGGTIVVSEGTWLAGRDGPPAMIMPAEPQVGQAFRPEQIPGIVFEEVTVAEIGVTADGPFGPVEGAVVTSELHLDGTRSDKLFAPGYGEFYTGHDGDVEALSVAVPTDRIDEPEPAALAELLTGTWGLVESARLEEWEAVDATLARITDDWNAVAVGPVPARLADIMDASFSTLTEAVTAQDSGAVAAAAVDVAETGLDIQLLYRPAAAIDVERFHLHSQQLRIDAAAADTAGVAAEVATLEWLARPHRRNRDGRRGGDDRRRVGRAAGRFEQRKSRRSRRSGRTARQPGQDAQRRRDRVDEGIVDVRHRGRPCSPAPEGRPPRRRRPSRAPRKPRTSEPAAEETLVSLAPESQRVDVTPPVFSNPAVIVNPLFPVNDLSAVTLGNDEGVPVKVETSVLPDTLVIDVDGHDIETRGQLQVEYQHGRMLDVAVKWFAQADDGSVWWLGEDVYAYDDGVLADTEGTWRADPDHPIVMIMPGDPQGGEVFRPENLPDSIEEYTVTEVGLTIDGPTGPIDGAIVVQENHAMEGLLEDKWFAPGYGEFAAGLGDSWEEVAVAVPADAAPGPVPAELAVLADGAVAIADAAVAEDWDTVSTTRAELLAVWHTYRVAHDVPPLLAVQMDRALTAAAGDALVLAADADNVEGTANAALDVAQAALDLQLRFRPPVEIERERFELWARQLVVDANRIEVNPGFVAGDVATLEWLLMRFAPTVEPEMLASIDELLSDLRTAADDEDIERMSKLAPWLVESATRIA